jgi:hypothetical protein
MATPESKRTVKTEQRRCLTLFFNKDACKSGR